MTFLHFQSLKTHRLLRERGPGLAKIRPVTPRILIVDDEKSIRFAIDRYFGRYGYVVDSASSSAEARALLHRNDYDLAILDLNLGVTDSSEGLDLAAWIRTECSATPVIILTALSTAEVELRATSLGVSSLLRKPMRLSVVADVALRLIGNTTNADTATS
jgi:two-component system, NtrC family, response regulator AlgB